MSILNKFPWLYVGLLFLAYNVFGRIVTESINSWSIKLVERAEDLRFLISPIVAQALVDIIIIVSIIALILIFSLTVSWKILNLLFVGWLESNVKAVFSVFFWVFTLVLIICWLQYFLRLLILLSASILVKLELQTLNYKNYQVLAIVFFISLIGFITGCLSSIY